MFLQKERMTRLEQCATLLKEIVDVKAKTMEVFESTQCINDSPEQKDRLICVIEEQRRDAYGYARNQRGDRYILSHSAALESVFPMSELNSFINLPKHDKEAQLNGLTNLVTGIRLFNKHLEKGGDTIDECRFGAHGSTFAL